MREELPNLGRQGTSASESITFAASDSILEDEKPRNGSARRHRRHRRHSSTTSYFLRGLALVGRSLEAFHASVMMNMV